MAEENVRFEADGQPFSMEWVRRTEPYSMGTDHYHGYYELYYLLAGERHYFIRDRSYRIRAGDLVFIDKRELHKTAPAGGEAAHERLVVYFFDALLRPAYERHAGLLLGAFRHPNPVCRLPLQEQARARRIVETLLAEMRNREPGCEIALKHGLIELLLLAARNERHRDAAIEPPTAPLHRKMSEVAGWLNAHYAEPVSLAELAARFHLSPAYLSRSFPRAVGLTVTAYVNLVRIRAAERLLKETDMSVTGVAHAVGYDNFSHFGKMFKKITRMPPRAYRKS